MTQPVREQGGDDLLAVKANQETLYEGFIRCFDQVVASDVALVSHDHHGTEGFRHMRHEERGNAVSYDPAGLATKGEWPDLWGS